jgi:hypothetical protein
VTKPKPTPTPVPTDTPCAALSCEAPSKFWKWTVVIVITAPQGNTTYTITGTTCGRPQSATWTVQYAYVLNSHGDVTTNTFYDDGRTTLTLTLNSFVTFPVATNPDFPNPDFLQIKLRYDHHGRVAPGTFGDEITPKVSVAVPFKVKGLPAPGPAIPISDCASG